MVVGCLEWDIRIYMTLTSPPCGFQNSEHTAVLARTKIRWCDGEGVVGGAMLCGEGNSA